MNKAEEFEQSELHYYNTMDRYEFAEAYAKHVVDESCKVKIID